MSDNDGIDDALRNAAQLTAGMLARLGETQSRAAQQHAVEQERAIRAASTQDEQQIRQAAGQEQAALARLQLVHDPNWWAAATITQVGDTWQIADAYRGHQDADAAREVMTREITNHWGVALEAQADLVRVRRLLEQAEHDRHHVRAESRHADDDRGNARVVGDERKREDENSQQVNGAAELRSATLTGADEDSEIEQRHVRADGLGRQYQDAHDSAEQRQARVEGYARSGNPRASESRILADEGNALPPTYATRTRSGRRRRPSRGPCQPFPRYRIVSDHDGRAR